VNEYTYLDHVPELYRLSGLLNHVVIVQGVFVIATSLPDVHRIGLEWKTDKQRSGCVRTLSGILSYDNGVAGVPLLVGSFVHWRQLHLIIASFSTCSAFM
jgi:hypothetical protein